MRRHLRNYWFRFFEQTLNHPTGRAMLISSLIDLLDRNVCSIRNNNNIPTPYPNIGHSRNHRRKQGVRPDAPTGIFITGRFRSGSTLLWNIFRHTRNATAYYEPLNERRWFDPQKRGYLVDQTHRFVSDYWSEYEKIKELAPSYSDDWPFRRLYMDEYSSDIALKQYISMLIENAKGVPVLQFNRIDFRLGWLRSHFPAMRILNIIRNPRDQWCSTIRGIPLHQTKNSLLSSFRKYDHYYLVQWVEDLQHQFPLLKSSWNEHPYRAFYLLWKLSYLHANKFSCKTIRYEDLIDAPDRVLRPILEDAGIEVDNWSITQSLIDKRPKSRWQEYATHDWYLEHEAAAETELTAFFTTPDFQPPATLLTPNATQ